MLKLLLISKISYILSYYIIFNNIYQVLYALFMQFITKFIIQQQTVKQINTKKCSIWSQNQLNLSTQTLKTNLT